MRWIHIEYKNQQEVYSGPIVTRDDQILESYYMCFVLHA